MYSSIGFRISHRSIFRFQLCTWVGVVFDNQSFFFFSPRFLVGKVLDLETSSWTLCTVLGRVFSNVFIVGFKSDSFEWKFGFLPIGHPFDGYEFIVIPLSLVCIDCNLF